MRNSITVIINTFNEEKNIVNCIKSAKLLNQAIIIIDMQSVDGTVSLAKESGVKVFSFPYSGYVEPARRLGIEKTETPWVFILDADERITEKLAIEIQNIIMRETNQSRQREIASSSDQGCTLYDNRVTHYKIPRKNIFSQLKWLKYGGWWPDYQIRLIKKEEFIDWPKEIHSTPKIRGVCGFLKNPILHYFHGDFKKMVEKTIVFEDVESNLLLKAGKSVSTSTFFRKFFGELLRRLIKNSGFLDGTLGIIESIYQAFSKTITYIFLYEKKLKSGSL